MEENNEKKVEFFEKEKDRENVDVKKLLLWCLDQNYVEGFKYMVNKYEMNTRTTLVDRISPTLLDVVFRNHTDREIKMFVIAKTTNDDFRDFIWPWSAYWFTFQYENMLGLTTDVEKKLILEQKMCHVSHESIFDYRFLMIGIIPLLLFVTLLIIYKYLFFVGWEN